MSMRSENSEMLVLVGKSHGFSPSMARYYELLRNGLEARGARVLGVTPATPFSRLLPKGILRYRVEYLEQSLLLPRQLQRILRRLDRSSGRLAAVHVCDQADAHLGRILGDRPRSITVHDCIARRVLAGEFPGQTKGLAGRWQQERIYRWLRAFPRIAAVSEATREDLTRFLPDTAARTVVIPNGPVASWRRLSVEACEERLAAVPAFREWKEAGMPPLLLVVAGDVFYKNRAGALELAAACNVGSGLKPWVLLIGPSPESWCGVPAERRLHLPFVPDEALEAWYSLAAALLFPSLAEGFGWPLLEAQQTGCLVVTTDRAPMNRVANAEALRLPLIPAGHTKREAWVQEGAAAISNLLAEPLERREQRREGGYAHAQRYSIDSMIDGYLELWEDVLDS